MFLIQIMDSNMLHYIGYFCISKRSDLYYVLALAINVTEPQHDVLLMQYVLRLRRITTNVY